MKYHYVFLMGGSLIGYGNFESNDDAIERARELSLQNSSLVGAYKMIGSSESE